MITEKLIQEMERELKDPLIDILTDDNKINDSVYHESKNKLSLFKKRCKFKKPRKQRRILRRLLKYYVTPTQRLLLAVGKRVVQNQKLNYGRK